ncbi:MAG: hypothetical protein K2O04_05740 [Clostridiales bacterium]|nr:hypothetical protein [Clostridiales bacterium]
MQLQLSEYTESMGRINVTGEMLMELMGLPIDEQLHKFAVETIKSVNGAQGASSKSKLETPDKCYAVKSIITKGGVVVGVEFAGRFGRVYGFLDEYCNIEYSTYYDSQNSQTHSTDCVLRWVGENNN